MTLPRTAGLPNNPLLERCVVSGETTPTTIERTRHLISHVDHPVAVFFPDEPDPAPPATAALVAARLDQRLTSGAPPMPPLQPSAPPNGGPHANLVVSDHCFSPAHPVHSSRSGGSDRPPTSVVRTGSLGCHQCHRPRQRSEPSPPRRTGCGEGNVPCGRRGPRAATGSSRSPTDTSAPNRARCSERSLPASKGVALALDDVGIGISGGHGPTRSLLAVTSIDQHGLRLTLERSRSPLERSPRLTLATLVEGGADRMLLPARCPSRVDGVEGIAPDRACPPAVGAADDE